MPCGTGVACPAGASTSQLAIRAEGACPLHAGDKPLALYAFSQSRTTLDHIVDHTSSGGVCLNHVVLQLTAPSLPFGGVGESGIGAYHGRAHIDAFSHRRSVLAKPTSLDPPLLYPPFTKLKQRAIRKAMTWL